MDTNYKKLVDGIDQMGQALIAIGNSEDHKPIKLLVSRLIGKLGFNNQEVGDDIAMIRWAVENDDETLEKLTEHVTGGGIPAAPVAKEEEKEA